MCCWTGRTAAVSILSTLCTVAAVSALVPGSGTRAATYGMCVLAPKLQ